MHDPWGDSFTDAEQATLAPFVTNLHRPIFGLRNLPEVVKGALFSRYSRTDKSLRRILLDEFITAPESGFERIVGAATAGGADQMVATRQAEAFYERVLIGYGDDSVAELGGAHVACEGVSNIAAKALEESRLGIDPLEKSTRYVAFNRQVEGRWRYCRVPEIMASRHADLYEQALDGLFATYSELIPETLEWVQRQSPRDDKTSERAYTSATRAKAFDLLRGLLPMATLTNVGMFGNGRAFEYLLTKLAASSHGEVRQIGSHLQEELDALIPSFVKRARTKRGAQYSRYLAGMRAAGQPWAAPIAFAEADPAVVRLVEYDPQAEVHTVASILYPHSDAPLAAVREHAAGLGQEEREAILRAYVGERGSRFHRPGRAFEEAYYTFDLLADIGAYRDLQRHRILTQERQRYTTAHGYVTPPELADAGLDGRYGAALERAADAYAGIHAELPAAAEYLVPFAYRIRWRIKLNLREAYHLIELRASPQGHPTYRAIAQAMFREIERVHPTLAAGMRFVDLNDYALERLAAEQRLDAKAASRESGIGNRESGV
jgi:thymidylate synthase ThyX